MMKTRNNRKFKLMESLESRTLLAAVVDGTEDLTKQVMPEVKVGATVDVEKSIPEPTKSSNANPEVEAKPAPSTVKPDATVNQASESAAKPSVQPEVTKPTPEVTKPAAKQTPDSATKSTAQPEVEAKPAPSTAQPAAATTMPASAAKQTSVPVVATSVVSNDGINWETVNLRTMDWSKVDVQLIDLNELAMNVGYSAFLDFLMTHFGERAFVSADGARGGFRMDSVNLYWLWQSLVSANAVEVLHNGGSMPMSNSTGLLLPDVNAPVSAFAGFGLELMGSLIGQASSAAYSFGYSDAGYPDYTRLAKPMWIDWKAANLFQAGVMKARDFMPITFASSSVGNSDVMIKLTEKVALANIGYVDAGEALIEGMVGWEKVVGDTIRAVDALKASISAQAGSQNVVNGVIQRMESIIMVAEEMTRDRVTTVEHFSELSQSMTTLLDQLKTLAPATEEAVNDGVAVTISQQTFNDLINSLVKLNTVAHDAQDGFGGLGAIAESMKANGEVLREETLSLQLELQRAAGGLSSKQEKIQKAWDVFSSKSRGLAEAKAALNGAQQKATEDASFVDAAFKQANHKAVEDYLIAKRNMFVAMQALSVALKKLPRAIQVAKAVDWDNAVPLLGAFGVEFTSALVQQVSIAIAYGGQLWIAKTPDDATQKAAMGFIVDLTFVKMQLIFAGATAVHGLAQDWNSPQFKNMTTAEYVEKKVFTADLPIDIVTGGISLALTAKGTYGSVGSSSDGTYGIEKNVRMVGYHTTASIINQGLNPAMKVMWAAFVKPFIMNAPAVHSVSSVYEVATWDNIESAAKAAKQKLSTYWFSALDSLAAKTTEESASTASVPGRTEYLA